MQKSQVQIDQNIKPTTLNFIEVKVGSTLEHIGTGDHFLNITPATWTLIAIFNRWDHLKLKTFWKAEEMFNKMAAYRIEKGLLQPHFKQMADIQNI